jgi:hypothetical protein
MSTVLPSKTDTGNTARTLRLSQRALMPIYQDVAMPLFDSANKLVTMARVL